MQHFKWEDIPSLMRKMYVPLLRHLLHEQRTSPGKVVKFTQTGMTCFDDYTLLLINEVK